LRAGPNPAGRGLDRRFIPDQESAWLARISARESLSLGIIWFIPLYDELSSLSLYFFLHGDSLLQIFHRTAVSTQSFILSKAASRPLWEKQ
jgi:hypothetical protein